MESFILDNYKYDSGDDWGTWYATSITGTNVTITPGQDLEACWGGWAVANDNWGYFDRVNIKVTNGTVIRKIVATEIEYDYPVGIYVNGNTNDPVYGTKTTGGESRTITFERVNAAEATLFVPNEDKTIISQIDVYYGDPVPAAYTVTWKNWDGTVPETDEDVVEGTTPEYNGTTPTRADDETYTYTFVGWDKELTAVTEDATYTATFTTSPSPATLVIEKINAIGTVENTAASKAKVSEARTAYDALTDAQKAFVTNYTTLTAAEETVANFPLVTGSFGTLNYVIDKDGVLTFSGSGPVPQYAFAGDYDYNIRVNLSDKIKKIIINDSVTVVNRRAFSGCYSLTEVVFESNPVIEGVGSQFCRDSALVSVTLPEGMENITAYMFQGCTALKQLEIPSSVTFIDSYAFKDTGITSLTIPAGARLNNDVFTNSAITALTISEGVTYHKYAFKDMSALKSVTFEGEPREFESGTFTGLSALQSVTVTECSTYVQPGKTQVVVVRDYLAEEYNEPITEQELADIQALFESYLAKGYDEEYALQQTLDHPAESYGDWGEFALETGSNTTFVLESGKQYPGFCGNATVTVILDAATQTAIDAIDAIGAVEFTDACKEKIDAARAAYDALTDDQKAFVTNYETLTAAEADYAALQLLADKAAFDAYKAEKRAAVEAMAEEGNSEAARQIIADAAAAIDALTYDEAKTLDENKAAVDAPADIADALAAQRAADKAAAETPDTPATPADEDDRVCPFCGERHDSRTFIGWVPAEAVLPAVK